MKGTIKGAMTRLMSTDGGGQLGVTRQAPLGFRMKDALGKFLRICKEPQYRPVLYCTAAASVLTSWYLAYSFFTERNYRSSFLVRQTLYNLRCNAGVCKVLGVTPQIVPRTTTGYMYQRRGDADISFDVVGKDGMHCRNFHT